MSFLAACTPTAPNANLPPLCVTPTRPATVYAGRDATFYYQTGLAVNKKGSLMFTADTNDNMVAEIYCGLGELHMCAVP